MQVVIEKNEILDNKTAADLLLFLSDKEGGKEQIEDIVNNNIDNIYKLYLHVKKNSPYYALRDAIIESSSKLSHLDHILTTTRCSVDEIIETLAPYRKEIIAEIQEILGYRYYQTGRTMPYLQFDIFALGINVDLQSHTRHFCSDIRDFYKYIIEPVKTGKIELDNSTREILFEVARDFVLSKARLCSQTNSHLNTIKSTFAYIGEETLQTYIQAFLFFQNNFDKYNCEERISKEAYNHFCKKFNKWACSELIK